MRFVGLVLLVMAVPIAGMILLYLGGTSITRLHYRRRRGMAWSEAMKEAEAGRGCLVVDHAAGASWGLGKLTIWWLPDRLPDPRIAASWIRSKGRLVDCPKELRTARSLQDRFPSVQVIENHSVMLSRRP